MSRCILLFALGVSNGEAGIGDDRQEDAKVLPTSKASLVRLGAKFVFLRFVQGETQAVCHFDIKH